MAKFIVSGKTYCGLGRFVNSFVVDGKEIIETGEDLWLKYPELEVRCYEGLICPGFNDSHMHLLNLGHFLANADLRINSLKGVIAALKAFEPLDGVILGRGFNQDYFEDEQRFPDRYDLDEVSRELPVIITRACGHICVVNSKALELLGLSEKAHTVEGGLIETDEKGVPTGVFKENAVEIAYGLIPVCSLEGVKSRILKAMVLLNSYGITSSQTDDFETLSGVGYEMVIRAYEELVKEGKCTVRVNEQAQFTNTKTFKEFFEKYSADYGDHYFKIGPLKMLGDGSLGARTANISRPYADKEDTQGIAVYSQEQFDSMVKMAREHKMPVAIHAIGDACLERVLKSYERYLRADEGHRCGVVHCQIMRPEQLEVFRKLKLHAYIQSIFLDYDNHIVEKRVGKELAATSYVFKSLDEATTLSNGSDSPVEMPDVMAGIECAVRRCSIGEDNVFNGLEALSVERALDSFGYGGAFASFEEDFKGQIAAGMVADFVVLEQDLFSIEAREIHSTKVVATYMDGQLVYGE